jgi:hypothetical protein
MNRLIALYPEKQLHVILDNLSTHKPKEDPWLKQHPRVHFILHRPMLRGSTRWNAKKISRRGRQIGCSRAVRLAAAGRRRLIGMIRAGSDPLRRPPLLSGQQALPNP